MNGESIYLAMDIIDDGAVAQAVAPVNKKRGGLVRRALPAAAAACLILGVGAAMAFGGAASGKKNEDEKQAGVADPTQQAEFTEQPLASDEPSPTEVFDYPAPTESAEWLRFFKHAGEMYYEHRILPAEADIFGDRIGIAYFAAELNKKHEDYGELAGSMRGSVYKVKGVDPRLFLCMREQDGRVVLFINETNADFARGSDLFEDMLHISESGMKLRMVEYGGDEEHYYELDPGRSGAADELIALMDRGECVMQPTGVYSGLGKSMDLLFCREDGLTVSVTARRGGFVELSDHRITQEGKYLRFKVDEEELGRLMDELEANRFEIPDDEFRIAEDLASCAKDERLGKYVPQTMPEGYELVYATIYRKIDEQTGALLDTQRIEFELKDAGDRYLCADISYYKSKVVQSHANYENMNALLFRESAMIDLKGDFGVTEEVFREFVESFGE